MDRVNVWFNRTFSSTYHLIAELRSSGIPFDFRFFGTHPNRNSLFLLACDHSEIEPDTVDGSYLEFALDFCRKFGIDVMVPGEFSMRLISRHRSDFESMGVRLMLPAVHDVVEGLSGKTSTYALLEGLSDLKVPEHHTVENPDQFQEACIRLQSAGKTVCFKPDRSQGGMGFRYIREPMDPCREFTSYPGFGNTFDYFHGRLMKCQEMPRLIVMEYLPGPETSVDCLSDAGILKHAVPRRKQEGFRIIERNFRLETLSRELCRHLDVSFLVNFQFRLDVSGDPCLLEVNLRPSGGLHHTSQAGHPMMTAAMLLLLTGRRLPLQPVVPVTFVEVGMPIRVFDANH